MTPDPKSLAVLLDAARACYGDDSEQVRWLLHPEAVRILLKATPASPCGDREETRCWWCHFHFLDEAHSRTCVGAAAWRDLGDPRGAADIERAHEEALRTLVVRRGARLDPVARTLPPLTWRRFNETEPMGGWPRPTPPTP